MCFHTDLRWKTPSTDHGDAVSVTDMGKQANKILLMFELARPASGHMEEIITDIVSHGDGCYHQVPTDDADITMFETFHKYPLWPRNIVLLNTSGRTFTTIIDAMFDHADLENYVTISDFFSMKLYDTIVGTDEAYYLAGKLLDQMGQTWNPVFNLGSMEIIPFQH